ncbi:MAG: IS1595 family transposase [Alphaproteobacteria bacterium]
MSDNIYQPHFLDEDKAREHLESIRWPDGPECPHCGLINATKLTGKAHRKGVYQCNKCREQFTVTVGTVFERSKVPLHKWLLATHLMCASKKGISAHQLHRMLGVTYKTAWFMAHRIREAMKQEGGPLGGAGSDVEADETYIGRDKSLPKNRTAIRHMNKVISLVDRSTGRSVSFHVTHNLTAEVVSQILYTNIDRKSRLITDEAHFYKRPGLNFAGHGRVSHAQDEYVSPFDRTVHTNTVEGFFAIFKRGMRGVYQHCGSQHLHRYLAEFDFRYSNREGCGFNDWERTAEALKGIAGKRLTYRRTCYAAA